MEYKPRIADKLLEFKLRSKGAVLIEGAKWCGKTTTAEQVARSVLYLGDSATKQQNLALADLEPQKLLEGATPRLIDEWQLAPGLWDAVRYSVDHRDGLGHFILTGSSMPADFSKIAHSGTGRFTRLKMRPMSLYESGDSNGSVSLSGLFNGEGVGASVGSGITLDRLAYLACRGGWPKAITLEPDVALAQAFDYVDSVVNEDYSKIDKIKRNPERMQKILRSYTRLQGSQAPIETIVADIRENEQVEISRDTIESYLHALGVTFVIEDAPAWNANLRSKTAIRTTSTRYFVDPSIATAALGLGPDALTRDLHLFGFIFETLCIRDLRVYAEAIGAKVYHYRDKRDLECDAVIALKNGDYALVEIKLGGDRLIEDGVETLDALARDLQRPPAFKMVLTGTSEHAYRREDGTLIVPIGCLRD